jgi:polyisoprenyl-teichoic acid--peptidoglycan teichoic acid transferase
MKRAEYYTRPRDTYPRRLLRAFLSFLVPGTGQLLAGARRRGFIMLAIVGVILIGGLVLLSRGTDTILSYAVQPKILLGLIGFNVILLLFRVFAMVDAFLTVKSGTYSPARPPGARMGLIGAALALLLILTIGPHAVAGYYTAVSHSLLTSVFAGDGDDRPDTTSTTQVGSSNPGSTGTIRSTTTTTEAELDWGSDDRMTILLIGSDGGYGRKGARADSINVASIDLKTGNVALFGIPRNTAETPLGEKTAEALGKTTYTDIINSLYFAGWQHPEIAPEGGDPGAEAVRETASLILGIPIDYYAVVDMMGLVDMVDAVGGVTVRLRTPMNITYAPLQEGEEKKTYNFPAGVMHFDGLEALAYARNRIGSDDYTRMARQRCILMGMLDQNGAAELTLRFPKIASAIKKSLVTDMPVEALPALIKIRSKLNTGEMISVGFVPPDYISGRNAERYPILDLAKVRQTVKTVLDDPEQWLLDHPPTPTSGDSPDSCWKISKEEREAAEEAAKERWR